MTSIISGIAIFDKEMKMKTEEKIGTVSGTPKAERGSDRGPGGGRG